MIISMIAAMAKNRVIGADNQMPWHLPADLKHFKAVTMGKPVVMGRKTYESIGKALPGRLNIVVTRGEFTAKDATVVNSIEEVLVAAGNIDELMIIGGGTIYDYFLPKAQRLYLTHIDLDVAGDTQFPDYTSIEWRQLSDELHQPDEKNPYGYRFETLERI